MGEVQLFHPVDEDKAREFVDATYPTDTGHDEDTIKRDKEARTQALLEGARTNAAWRESRDAHERLQLQSVPFASSPDNTDPAFTGAEGGDGNASA